MHTMASRKNKISAVTILGIILAVALVGLLVLVARNNAPADAEKYNGFPIQRGMCPGTTRECVLLSFEIRGNPYQIPFYNHPQDIESLPVAPAAVRSIIAMQKVENQSVLIVIPPNAPGDIGVAGVQLGRILGDRYGIMNLNVRATSAANLASACTQANATTLVVWFESDKLNAVHEAQKNCIAISAIDGPGAVAGSEALTYRILGVIPTLSAATQ